MGRSVIVEFPATLNFRWHFKFHFFSVATGQISHNKAQNLRKDEANGANELCTLSNSNNVC